MYTFLLLIAELYMQLLCVLLWWLLLSIFGSLFLEKFGNIDGRNKIKKKLGFGEDGGEFLHACKIGHVALVESMLKLTDSSVLNHTDDQENCEKTGLHLACENDKLEVVKLLVKDPKIDINIKDSCGKSAWDYCKGEQISRALLESGKLNIQDDIKFNEACKFGSVAIVESLLKSLDSSVLNHADPENYGKTGLHWACEKNRLEVVKLLVEDPKIDINVNDKYGYSALAYGIGYEQVARVLLESGKLDIQKMRGVEKFVENAEDGSIQFEFYGRLIKMDSPTSVQSISFTQP